MGLLGSLAVGLGKWCGRKMWRRGFVQELGKWYCEEVCRAQYEGQKFSQRNERPIEYRFVFRQLQRTCPTTVLDVGTGTTALPDLMRTCGFVVTASDNVSDYWEAGLFNRHFHVVNDDIRETRLTETYDFISCISVLEHIRGHGRAMASMFSLLKPRGRLAVTFPYSENRYVENVYAMPEAGYGRDFPFPCQVYSRGELDGWVGAHDWSLEEQEFWRFFEGELWTFGERLTPPRQVERHERHQLTCVLLRKNP
jgi:SAM-dependent methyltransferase